MVRLVPLVAALVVVLLAAGERPEVTWWGLGQPTTLAEPKPTLRVAIDAAYPPLATVDDRGAMVGLEIDLIQALGAQLGVSMQLINTDMGDGLESVSLGRYDLVLASLFHNRDFHSRVHYSEPYFNAGPVLVGRAGAPFTPGSQVLVEVGTPWVEELDSVRAAGGQVEWVWDLEESVQRVATGFNAFVLLDRPTALEQVREAARASSALAVTDLPMLTRSAVDYGYRVAIGRTNRPLAFAIDKALTDLAADGTLERLERKWLGPERYGD